MPITRDEFDGRGIDWRQRILSILNADRTLAYSDEELLQLIHPSAPPEQLKEALAALVQVELIRSSEVNGRAYYVHALRGAG